MTSDAQLEALARRDMRGAIDHLCLDAATQCEVLYEEFPEAFHAMDPDDDDAAMPLIARYDAILRRIRDEHFPAAS